MAEEIKEDEAVEEEPVEDAEGDASPDEEKEKESKKKKKSGKSGSAKPKKKSGRKKWISLIIFLLLAGAAGTAYHLFPEIFSFLPIPDKKPESIAVDEDILNEEALDPFFIPPGASAGAIRIDLVAAWDNLAAVKYKKKELNARNMIYDKLLKMAGETRDLNNNIPALENELSLLLKNSLGVQNLVIRIKEIRYF